MEFSLSGEPFRTIEIKKDCRSKKMSNLIVETRHGKVQGYEQGSISVWKGIPFAQPPTRERRFRAPQPPEPWTGVREATAFSPMAPQVQEAPAAIVGANRIVDLRP